MMLGWCSLRDAVRFSLKLRAEGWQVRQCPREHFDRDQRVQRLHLGGPDRGHPAFGKQLDELILAAL
jgi:hypothetical protein